VTRTRVGLVAHHQRPLAEQLALEVVGWLQSEGHDVVVPGPDAAVTGATGVPEDRFADGLDFAVSVGGDGTMLRTVALVARAGVPVLGINRGHLGYLTVVEADDWKPALAHVLDGDFRTEQRMTLDVSVLGPDGASRQPRIALNDAVVEKSEAGHTVRVALAISGQHAISYAADALIVATPTGSTAYNLSAGGPIVTPNLSALVVTPVAAHSLFGRPLVVGPGEVVRVEVEAGGAVLGVDGVHCARLSAGDVVECRESGTPARLVMFGERDFWQVVTTKFGLDPR